MFNFNIFTKALTDTTLTKNEFRVLCLMLNTSSFKQSNTFEMYNGFIQDTLGISERNVRDITKSLELKEYIKKEVSTNSHNRNANTYTIIDAESCAEKCAEKCAENCPPNNIIKTNNNNKINKSKDNSIDIYDTGVTPGTKAKINKNENGDMDMMENATRGKVVKSEDLTNSIIGIEQNKDNSSTGEMDMEIRNIDGLSSSGDTGESKVSAVSDNGTSVKNAKRNEVKRNDNKNITSTQRTGNNSSTDENDTSKREALVAATMQKIDQLKRQMYDSRNSELNFNIFFDEFKRCMDVMKANTSTEAYNNYRAQIGKWWRNTKQYLPYREEKITAAADAPHTDEVAEKMKLDYAVESCIYERNTDKVQGGLMYIIKYFETHTDDKLAEEIIQKLNNHRHSNAILDSVLSKIGIICF